jgi:hypothetical protein
MAIHGLSASLEVSNLQKQRAAASAEVACFWPAPNVGLCREASGTCTCGARGAQHEPAAPACGDLSSNRCPKIEATAGAGQLGARPRPKATLAQTRFPSSNLKERLPHHSYRSRVTWSVREVVGASRWPLIDLQPEIVQTLNAALPQSENFACHSCSVVAWNLAPGSPVSKVALLLASGHRTSPLPNNWRPINPT